MWNDGQGHHAEGERTGIWVLRLIDNTQDPAGAREVVCCHRVTDSRQGPTEAERRFESLHDLLCQSRIAARQFLGDIQQVAIG